MKMFFFSLLLGAAVSSGALANENRAVEIGMFGTGPAIDAEAYQTLLNIVGSFVSEGKLQKYLVYGYGIEGGSSFCIEFSPFVTASDMEAFIRDIGDIEYDPITTSFDFTEVESCRARLR